MATGTAVPLLQGGALYLQSAVGTEPVTYASVGTGGGSFAVANATPLSVPFKEAAASGGVYTQQDVKWILRQSELTNVSPKPADTITDGAGTVWTVLEVETNKYAGIAVCICRDLIIANALRDLADIYNPTNTQDGAANRVPLYGSPAYAAVPCRLQEITADRLPTQGKLAFTRTYTCYLSQRVIVTTESQVKIAGVTYQVRSYNNPDRIDQLMSLELEKLS